MLMRGVAVERTVLSLKQILVDFLPLRVHFVVLIALWMFIVMFPLAYAVAQLARVEHRQRYKDSDWQIMGVSVHMLRGDGLGPGFLV